MAFDMDGYVDVAERVRLLYAKHPEASLQGSWSVTEVGGRTFVVYVARCYRSPDDVKPGVGTAWEPFPGPTQFTRDSELQNAETSAWGRAIVAAGAADTRRIASAEEVRNRQDAEHAPGPVLAPKAEVDAFLDVVKAAPEAHRLLMNDWWREHAAGRPVTPEILDAAHAAYAALPRSAAEDPDPAAPVSDDPDGSPAPLAASPAVSGAVSDRWGELRKDDLVEMAERRGLPKSGTVDELKARIDEHDDAQGDQGIVGSCVVDDCSIARLGGTDTDAAYCAMHRPL